MFFTEQDLSSKVILILKQISCFRNFEIKRRKLHESLLRCLEYCILYWKYTCIDSSIRFQCWKHRSVKHLTCREMSYSRAVSGAHFRFRVAAVFDRNQQALLFSFSLFASSFPSKTAGKIILMISPLKQNISTNQKIHLFVLLWNVNLLYNKCWLIILNYFIVSL